MSESPGAGGAPGSAASGVPLADRIRPRSLDEIEGQPALRSGMPLRLLLEGRSPPSLILWGPPGTGKTSIARLVAAEAGLDAIEFSAVLSGVKEVRAAVDRAKAVRAGNGRRTMLFVDEIHRFNKAQQDAFLPHVEDGTIVLVGATTENPSFHINRALLSRSTLLVLEPLSKEALTAIALRALGDGERGLGGFGMELDRQALDLLASSSHGDARSLLNRLEAAILAAFRANGKGVVLTAAELQRYLPAKVHGHDRDGDLHYDLISALHKSVRGGHPDAALYWLARMMAAGEDPFYILRRLARMATEDIGLADPRALSVAMEAMRAYEFLGSPEGDLALAGAAVYLATAPKSAAVYRAFGLALDEARSGPPRSVPMHLRNAPTSLMRDLGFGRGYRYPHDFPEGVVALDYLPGDLKDVRWYEPSPFGHEKSVRQRMEWWARVLEQRKGQADG